MGSPSKIRTITSKLRRKPGGSTAPATQADVKNSALGEKSGVDGQSGTNRHRCSTCSTRSSEGVRDRWCSAASLSSPCACGWGPRLAACKTAPPMFLWPVPVFFERIQSSGQDAEETRVCCSFTVASIHVVPRHRCPAGTRSNLDQREFDSLAGTRKPAADSHPWLMWRCSQEEEGPLRHTSSWMWTRSFMDQRC